MSFSHEESHEVEYVEVTKAGEELTFRGQFMPKVQVWIDFSCQEVLRLQYDEQSVMEIQLDELSSSVFIEPEPDEFSTYIKTEEIIHKAIRNWQICDCHRERVIERVIHDAQKFVKSISPGYSFLLLQVEVKVTRNPTTVDESRMLQYVLEHSFEENNDYNMTPATDSSIESLEMKKLEDDDDDCSICLDEFYKGLIIACMPCSHMFHSNCITKWLKTSHYCPVCRFEMPS